MFQMKEQELEELRQQEANKTALAAIGPRKKRRIDELVSYQAINSENLHLKRSVVMRL